ncbi:hypothetical protein H4582DRAFT_2057715 [Lactarius indigo]|nr:hypothetical protein H4582DRAFT_2057715 [Lactarius indigo]
MGHYKLWYFVEGKDSINKIIISEKEDVAQLKEEIHKKCSRRFWDDVEAMELVLLKVDIDPKPHRDAISELQAPESATEMDPMQEINEIWPVQPNRRHLHSVVMVLIGADWINMVLRYLGYVFATRQGTDLGGYRWP